MTQATHTMLDVRHLKKYFNSGKRNEVRAVDDVSFSIHQGETFGLVGESGCGKTTIGRTIINLYHPTEGNILFDGTDINQIHKTEAKRAFRKQIQMIFQDPYASLDPKMKVRDIIAEGLELCDPSDRQETQDARIQQLLAMVGLDESHETRYPHEFSGGQRQRIGIARALAVRPKFVICDEPISALDVSIQAQVINLLQELQQAENLTYLFIAHDLSMVKHISNRIGVMCFGKLVEVGGSSEIYHYGIHPYTESLLSAIPIPDPDYERGRKRISYIHTRERGDNEQLREISPDHFVYCSVDEVADYRDKLEAKKQRGNTGGNLL